MTELDVNKAQQRPLDIPEFLKDPDNQFVTLKQIELDKLWELHKHAKRLAFLHGLHIGVCTASMIFIIAIVLAGIFHGELPW